MSWTKTDLPIMTHHSSYGNPARCVSETSTGSYTNLEREVYNGEDYVRLSNVTKSDHVSATPWSFYSYEILNPESTIEVKYGGKAELGPYCTDKEFAYEIKFDGRSILPVKPSDITTPTLPKTVTDKVDSIAIVKAQAKLRKAAANLPMLYKERTQTVKTIGTYSRAILNNVITMQRRDVKKWLAAVKKHKNRPDRLKMVANTIADRHLEFVFGVLPLIDDISGLIDHVTEERRDFRTGRGAMSHVDESLISEVKPQGWTYCIDCVTKKTIRYSVRAAIRCDIDSTVLNDASRLGFNPIYAWYDMTPLSFVVGWFSNLNHWLQSLDGIPGLTFRTGYSTKRTEVEIQKTGVGFTRYSGSTKVQGSGDFNNTGKSIRQNRVVMTEMPGLQSLYFVDNTSFFAAAASVSLLIQRTVKIAEREIAVKPFKYRGKKPRNLPPINYRKVKSYVTNRS